MELRRPPAVLVSLAYLALFGSVVAFGAYFLLLKSVGAGPASFVGVSTPVLAMLLSTAFEGYRWTWIAAIGVVLAIAGNLLALRSRAPRARRFEARHPACLLRSAAIAARAALRR